MRVNRIIPLFFIPFCLFADFCNDKLELYYRPTCPYCVKVLKVIKEVKAPVTLKDISANSENLKTLVRVGGKQQVPCLFINGKPLYESSDIIDWLERESEQGYCSKNQ